MPPPPPKPIKQPPPPTKLQYDAHTLPYASSTLPSNMSVSMTAAPTSLNTSTLPYSKTKGTGEARGVVSAGVVW